MTNAYIWVCFWVSALNAASELERHFRRDLWALQHADALREFVAVAERELGIAAHGAANARGLEGLRVTAERLPNFGPAVPLRWHTLGFLRAWEAVELAEPSAMRRTAWVLSGDSLRTWIYGAKASEGT